MSVFLMQEDRCLIRCGGFGEVASGLQQAILIDFVILSSAIAASVDKW